MKCSRCNKLVQRPCESDAESAKCPLLLLQQRKDITVHYVSIGVCRSGTFQTIAGASKFARHWVGDHPDIGPDFATGADGLGCIAVEGARLADLFPEEARRERQ